MQKVKKAAAQLDSRAAVSVLNNLKNNQIVVENYDIFCELYEKAIACKDCSLAPLFSDGSLIVKMNSTMRTYVRYFTHNLFLKQWISTRRTLKPRCHEWVKCRHRHNK